MEMIRFDSVVKKYGRLTALDNVSISINEGEYVALLGPNGAGKTTLIRILLDFTRADSGSVTIKGIFSRSPEARRQIGYVAENLRIPPYLSGMQYLKRQVQFYDLDDAPGKTIEEVLKKVGMKERSRDKTGNYSKGMLQRIGLAAALLVKPKLLILDEPTAGLDPLGIRELRELLENLRSTGLTLMLNSHLLSEVEKLCDSAAIMDKGGILVKDTIPSLVREGETLEDVFVRFVKR